MGFEQRFAGIFKEIMALHQVSVEGSGEDPWDSLAHMNLVVSLEDEFEIEFSPDQIAGMVSYEKAMEITRGVLAESEVTDVTA